MDKASISSKGIGGCWKRVVSLIVRLFVLLGAFITWFSVLF